MHTVWAGLHKVFKISCLKNSKQIQVQQPDLQRTTQHLLAFPLIIRLMIFWGTAPYVITLKQTSKEYDNPLHCAQHDTLKR